jgi:hypothetical protein
VRTVGCWKIQAGGENLCGSGRGHHLFQIQRVWWREEVKKMYEDDTSINSVLHLTPNFSFNSVLHLAPNFYIFEVASQ